MKIERSKTFPDLNKAEMKNLKFNLRPDRAEDCSLERPQIKSQSHSL